MRDVTDLHPDASCRDPDYEHYWLYPECMKEEKAEVVIEPALCAVLVTGCNTDSGEDAETEPRQQPQQQRSPHGSASCTVLVTGHRQEQTPDKVVIVSNPAPVTG